VPDSSFEIGYANSVLHHDTDPNKAIEEISRVVSKRFILIEDTLQGKSEEEIALHAKKLFIDDYIYNRLLIDGDVPIPAKYRTASEWAEAFASFGWKLSQQDELGWSKILPSIFRERFVFDKE
jgi:ubiquinone/menaquinone biosynthesis C-methylase UbiE